jgi:predicted PurR-regulated permease PerM
MNKPENDAAPAGTWQRQGGAGMAGSQRWASLVATLFLVAAGIFTLKEFLPALAWTVIFAIALLPFFQKMGARFPRHKRELLPGLFVLGVVLVFVIPLLVIAVPLAADAHAAVQWVQLVQQSGLPAPAFLAKLPHGDELTALWAQKIGQPGQISVLTQGAIKGGGAKAASTFGRETLHRLVLFGFMLLGLFFFLRDADDVIAQLKVGSRRAFGAAGEDIGRQIVSSVHGTVNGLVLVGLGEGVLLGIAYVIAGVPHPTLFGLLTAILAMVPFGAAIAIAVAALVLLAQGSTAAAIVIIVLGAIVTFVADHFIRPVLIGGSTRLPFIWVLLGILGGVSAWGLVGLFVGPAIMAALILLWREWVGAQKGPINPAAADAAEAGRAAVSGELG